ncbi:MAG: GNAT family N-acetyltransferase [Anaerolineales bacterium]
MDVQLRAARPEDMPACIDLFHESLRDLLRRHNMPAEGLPPADRTLAYYQHTLDTGIFDVAEIDGRLVALACATVRDHLWFLAGFWARPAMQHKHLGSAILRRVWDAGLNRGATHFFVWSSMDLPALAAYMRLGMLPGTQLFTFEGSPVVSGETAAGYSVGPLPRGFAAAIDMITLGTGRHIDHEFRSRRGWLGRQVMKDGIGVGYYYLDGGSLGPAACCEPVHCAPMLALACGEAADSGLHVILRVPGMNHEALRFAFTSGLRLTNVANLLMSAPFGHLEQYVPSGPALF